MGLQVTTIGLIGALHAYACEPVRSGWETDARRSCYASVQLAYRTKLRKSKGDISPTTYIEFLFQGV